VKLLRAITLHICPLRARKRNNQAVAALGCHLCGAPTRLAGDTSSGSATLEPASDGPVRWPALLDVREGESIIFHGHPSWRAMLGFHVKGFLLAVAAGALAGVLSSLATGHVVAAWVVLAVALLFVIVLTRGALRRQRTTYTITNRRLTIELGLLGREVHETRIDQIQNVNASQSPLERALSIGDVSFDTAGGAAFDFSFRGVAHPRRLVRMVDDALRQRAPSRF
jgi:membrane protein YdbS with pleckstrin-like domain